MNRWLKIGLNVLSVGLFLFILWWGGVEAWQTILAGDHTPLLFAFGVYGVAGWVSGWRLRVIANGVSKRDLGTWRRFYQINMSARALGLVLPRTVSGIGGKAVGMKALGVSLRQSAWIVLVDNALDIGVLMVVGLPGLFFLQNKLSVAGFVGWTAALLGLVAVGLVWVAGESRLRPLLALIQRWPWLAQKLNLADPETAVIRLPSPMEFLAAFGLTILLNGTIALSYFYIGQAIRLTASAWLFIAAFAVAQLSLIIAIAPGGLGIFDFGWLGLLALGGVAEDGAKAFVIAQRAYIFVFVLLWTGFSALLALTVKESPVLPATDPEPLKPS